MRRPLIRARPAIFVSVACLLGIVACGPARSESAQPAVTHAPASAATLPTTSTSLSEEPVVARDWMVAIEQLTPTGDVGTFPLFEWEAVPDAARYTLVVKVLSGRPYWSWSGTELAVYLGGGTEPPPEDSVGPRLFEPMIWMVLAFDSDGALVGSSPARPIAP